MDEKKRMVQVTAYGQTKEYPFGTSFVRIAEDFADVLPGKALLVKAGTNKLMELNKPAVKDCSIEFLTIANKEGRDTYKRSLCLLMLKAFDNVLGGKPFHVWIRFTVSGGLFCTLEGDQAELTRELLDRVKAEMAARKRAEKEAKKEARRNGRGGLFGRGGKNTAPGAEVNPTEGANFGMKAGMNPDAGQDGGADEAGNRE